MAGVAQVRGLPALPPRQGAGGGACVKSNSWREGCAHVLVERCLDNRTRDQHSFFEIEPKDLQNLKPEEAIKAVCAAASGMLAKLSGGVKDGHLQNIRQASAAGLMILSQTLALAANITQPGQKLDAGIFGRIRRCLEQNLPKEGELDQRLTSPAAFLNAVGQSLSQ